MDTELTHPFIEPCFCNHSIQSLMDNKINPPNTDVLLASLILDKDTGRMAPAHPPNFDEPTVEPPSSRNTPVYTSFMSGPPRKCPPSCSIL